VGRRKQFWTAPPRFKDWRRAPGQGAMIIAYNRGERACAPLRITKAVLTDRIDLHEWITHGPCQRARGTASIAKISGGPVVSLASVGSVPAPFVGLFRHRHGYLETRLIDIGIAGQASIDRVRGVRSARATDHDRPSVWQSRCLAVLGLQTGCSAVTRSSRTIVRNFASDLHAYLVSGRTALLVKLIYFRCRSCSYGL